MNWRVVWMCLCLMPLCLGCDNSGQKAINQAMIDKINSNEKKVDDRFNKLTEKMEGEFTALRDSIGAASNPRVKIRVQGITFCPEPGSSGAGGGTEIDVNAYNNAAVNHVNGMQEALDRLKVRQCPPLQYGGPPLYQSPGSGQQGLGSPIQLPPFPGAPVN